MFERCEERCQTMEVGPRHLVIALVFVVGAIGNVAALWILHKSARTRNRKHVLLLRCLATNDLVAQIGMLIIISLQKFQLIPNSWGCLIFVLLRAFGIGSGCVAFVMALERWLALTRPFFYQQKITYQVIKLLALAIWCGGAFLTYLPLLGFGLYYNKTKDCCSRYRDARELSDKVYAYIFFTFGTCLCLCIAYCNLTVMWELSRIRSQGKVLVRRVSRSTIHNRIVSSPVKYQTAEEVAFAKLMAIICIIFIVCWGPQMILIPLAQFWPCSKFSGILTILADSLMCVYFTLDPYVYVLQRYKGKSNIDIHSSHTKKKGCFGRLSIFGAHQRELSNSMTTLPTTRTTTSAGTPTSVLLKQPSFTIPTDM